MSSIFSIDASARNVFFEKMVTELVAKIGYGEGRVTPPSNDGGIDGIVTQDAFGFDKIVIQAKCYQPTSQIGRPELQAFAGSLGSATRGVFITTATFSKPAQEYVATYPHAKIVLVNGQELTQLMIEYNVGVSEDKVIRLRKLDSDYFEG